MEIKAYPPERASAQRCANGVNAYWRKLGYDVNARVKVVQSPPLWGIIHESYEVASDTLNGLPIGFKRGERRA